MKGFLFYEMTDAERNKEFIVTLIEKANINGIVLNLVHQKKDIADDADFILFRSRNPELAKKLELKGYRLFNRAEVNKIANDKYKTFQLAQFLGIHAVPTTILKNLEDIHDYPVVLKTADGHGGHEVERCNNEKEAAKYVESMEGKQLLLQPYIETESTDVRVFVIGQEVVGAVKRMGQNSFKSNFTLGGRVEKYVVPSSIEQAGLKIARALKSDYIGVDFLLLPDGTWMLNEIEDPVGARSFYETHDCDIAELLIYHIKKELSGN